MKRRLFSLLLTGAMLLSMCSPGLALEQDSGGLCLHHPEHSFGDCGYVEAVEEVSCDMDCAETGEDGQIVHVEGCAYTSAVAGQLCGYVCRICPVQVMIDALPAPESIAPDNRTEAEAQLAAIDEARAELTDEEAGQLDISRYHDVAAALSALDGQIEADAPMLTADGDVDYLYCDSNGQNWQTGTKHSGEYTAVTADNTEWNTGWYVMSGTVDIESRVTVNGTVHLVLEDNCNLAVNGGINVSNGNALFIYGQSNDTGRLVTTGSYENAGIGGDSFKSTGSITIYGGSVDTTGGGNGAGIGGGKGTTSMITTNGGTITINGGSVNATNRGGGAGIGGGCNGRGGSITINGGIVNAESTEGAGIGGGFSFRANGGDGGNITINDGIVTAVSSAGAGIGGGKGDDGGSGGNITINGGTINATGSAGIGGGGSAVIWHRGGSGGSITITGGTVNATRRDDKGAGIGGGGTGQNNGSGGGGGTVIISGGMITATSIGRGRGDSDVGSFSTTEHGNAVVIVSSEIVDQTSKDSWSGIIIIKNSGEVYGGSVFPAEDFEIPLGTTLTIPENKNLTLYGVTMNNRGNIIVSGMLDYTDGVVNNFGSITKEGAGTILPDDKKWNEINPSVTLDVSHSVSGSNYTYGEEVTLTATIAESVSANALSTSRSIQQKIVVFYCDNRKIGEAAVSDEGGMNTASLIIPLKAPLFHIGSNVLTAEYKGGNNQLLSGVSAELPIAINKADITADKPIQNVVTEDSITLKAFSNDTGNVEYACVEGSGSTPATWQRSVTFNGLKSAAAYTFYVRCAGNNYYNPSQISPGATFYTAHATPVEGEGYTLDYEKEVVAVTDGYEAKLDDGGWIVNTLNIIRPGSSFQIRHVADVNGAPASEAVSVTTPVRPAAPGNLQGVNTSFAGESDGRITGVSTNMEYKLSAFNSWTACTSTEITGLAAGSYQVRVKAVENSSFASASAVVTVGSGAQRTYTVTVNSGTGSGTYAEGAVVTITATVPDGQQFTGWTVNEGGVTLADASNATTTFTMPAQAVTVTANFQSISSGGISNGGDGGSYTPPTYKPDVPRPIEGGGAAAVFPANPGRGDTVTVTPKPDQGYEVNQITVTDQNGNSVEVTVEPDGTYTFRQPNGRVKIEVTYKPIQPVETPWSSPFADVSEGDWYYEAVRFVQERGLMNGYSDGQFGPNDNLSRAQLAQILFNKEGKPGVNYLMDFSDVADEAWYAEAVRWAASQGIVGGYGNGTFGPDDPITREQLAVMLWRYSGSPAATNKELRFNDADEISGFALEALRWAMENGILNGYDDGRLAPMGQATRAQAAQMLKNFIENQEADT